MAKSFMPEIISIKKMLVSKIRTILGNIPVDSILLWGCLSMLNSCGWSPELVDMSWSRPEQLLSIPKKLSNGELTITRTRGIKVTLDGKKVFLNDPSNLKRTFQLAPGRYLLKVQFTPDLQEMIITHSPNSIITLSPKIVRIESDKSKTLHIEKKGELLIITKE